MTSSGEEKRIYDFVTRANWIILGVLCVAALLFFSWSVFTGVAAGGLIVTVNFTLLRRTLGKNLTEGNLKFKSILVKYYIRFMVSAIIIGFLIALRLVNPIGLIVGLSVMMPSVMAALFNEYKHSFCKEVS
jgi:hypothetical protein